MEKSTLGSKFMPTHMEAWGVQRIGVVVLKDVVIDKNDTQMICGEKLVAEIIHKWGKIEIHADGRLIIQMKEPNELGYSWNTYRWKPENLLDAIK